MYISSCLAYSSIKISVETIEDHLNFKLEDEKTGNAFSLTLSGPQAATLATGLIDVLILNRFSLMEKQFSLKRKVDRIIIFE